MARITLTVDGNVEMDADLGNWTADPPQILRDQLAAHTTPKLYMRCVLMVVADAAMSDTATDIDITTDGNDWTMAVSRREPRPGHASSPPPSRGNGRARGRTAAPSGPPTSARR